MLGGRVATHPVPWLDASARRRHNEHMAANGGAKEFRLEAKEEGAYREAHAFATYGRGAYSHGGGGVHFGSCLHGPCPSLPRGVVGFLLFFTHSFLPPPLV